MILMSVVRFRPRASLSNKINDLSFAHKRYVFVIQKHTKDTLFAMFLVCWGIVQVILAGARGTFPLVSPAIQNHSVHQRRSFSCISGIDRRSEGSSSAVDKFRSFFCFLAIIAPVSSGLARIGFVG